MMCTMNTPATHAARLGRGLREANGALGDLGTLLPLMLGAIAMGGLAPAPVLAGFGLAYLMTAAVYRLPVPVQPMKAVAALVVTGAVSPAALAASGVLLGAVLLLLGTGGAVKRLARAVPQSVLAGLQLGLGLTLGAVALGLMAEAPAVAGLTLAVLLLAFVAPALPAAVLALAVAAIAGQLLGPPAEAPPAPAAFALPGWPDRAEIELAVTGLALPQLAMTLTNAVLLTALVAGDLFGERAAHVTPRRLLLTSGAANLLLCPLGALPMCHGAGGLAAHHRFGARSGLAPALLGSGLLALALAPAEAARVLALLPAAGLGALLLVAAGQLALGRRLADARPSCRPVIALAALVTLWQDPFLGLLAGLAAETARVALLRRLHRREG
ncbi:putative sulfate/molybdate transporter [Paralimibaculum aggregatum]|uniref:Sulfate/molybdate transporter n=1 Tax=Paralimibaculum aggregatum TaxID=3036245 RepID=A0ABQ6LIN4_9RHOB|nr:putative sulfate/molybdate transporter [Limibaculum sp. NKW23]GMG83134.1 putative sulfate/molybdate transporter [Limibaculum sp. NKW23]